MLAPAQVDGRRANPAGEGSPFIGTCLRRVDGLVDDCHSRAVSIDHAGGDEKRHAMMRIHTNGKRAPLIDRAEPSIGEHVYYCGAGEKMRGDDPVGYRMV